MKYCDFRITLCDECMHKLRDALNAACEGMDNPESKQAHDLNYRPKPPDPPSW